MNDLDHSKTTPMMKPLTSTPRRPPSRRAPRRVQNTRRRQRLRQTGAFEGAKGILGVTGTLNTMHKAQAVSPSCMAHILAKAATQGWQGKMLRLQGMR